MKLLYRIDICLEKMNIYSICITRLSNYRTADFYALEMQKGQPYFEFYISLPPCFMYRKI